MSTKQQNSTTWKRMATWVLILLATAVQAVSGQEQPSNPFVLQPVSPSDSTVSTIRPAQQSLMPPVQTYRPSRNPTTNRSALQPMPAKGTLGRAVPRTGVPRTGVPRNPRPGMTTYVTPDGRVVHPTHVYRGGRIYRIGPSGNVAPGMTPPQPSGKLARRSAPPKPSGKLVRRSAPPKPSGKLARRSAPRPKVDYSMAPVQPAVPLRFKSKQTKPSVRRARIVDGAPLIRQEAVVSADKAHQKTARPKKTSSSKSASSGKRSNDARWLAGVRRMLDGNRSRSTNSSSAQRSNGRKPSSGLRIASNPKKKSTR